MSGPTKKVPKKLFKPRKTMYAYRDATGAKKLLSVKEAHAIAEKKKEELAASARDLSEEVKKRKLKEVKGSGEYKKLQRLENKHASRAKKLERPGYKVGKVAMNMGMRKVKSKKEKAEPASKAASKLYKKRQKAVA